MLIEKVDTHTHPSIILKPSGSLFGTLKSKSKKAHKKRIR